MKRLTKEQQRHLVRIWQTAGPELERIRREELRGLPYNWEDVDMLLDMGDYYDGPPRLTSGLVEMQRLFMKAARKQGLLPSVVREAPAPIPAMVDEPSRLVRTRRDASSTLSVTRPSLTARKSRSSAPSSAPANSSSTPTISPSDSGTRASRSSAGFTPRWNRNACASSFGPRTRSSGVSPEDCTARFHPLQWTAGLPWPKAALSW